MSALKFFTEKPVDSFLLLYLDIKTLPIANKLSLEKEVKKDLLELNNLLEHYNSLEFIKGYNTNLTNPRNQEEKTILEFYCRTIKKKELILEYLIMEIEAIALEKSKPESKRSIEEDKKHEVLYKLIKRKRDFPYKDPVTKFSHKGNKFNYEIDFEKLDYRIINPIKNKIGLFPFKSDLTKGYTEEIKRELLINYKKKYSDTHLNYICWKLAELPTNKCRQKIFEELRSLYQKKKWYGFYALALPQIEGIFSELTTIVISSKNPGKTLGDKAKYLRPYYDNSEFAFDYYEHFLPQQRNKFSHTGLDNEIQVKSIFLLLDLVHLLGIIESINSPLIKISNILKHGVSYFTHIGKISNFIYVFKKIKNSRLIEIQEKIYNFSLNFFSSTIDLKQFLENLQKDFNSSTYNFELHLESICRIREKAEFKIFTLTNREISNRIDDIKSLLSDDFSLLLEDYLKLLFDTAYFMNNYSYIFKNTPKSISTQILKFEEKNKDTLQKINIIMARIKPEITNDDFLFRESEFKHIIR